MTNEELIAKFNPANAQNLTEGDLDLMRQLDDAQLDLLAKRFPNEPNGRGYLILYDTTLDAKKQLYSISTWQNLRNVRKYSNMKKLIPYTFKVLFMQQAKAPTTKPLRVTQRPSSKPETVDLSAKEAARMLREHLKGTDTAATATTVVTAPVKPPAPLKPPARNTGQRTVVPVDAKGKLQAKGASKTGKGAPANTKPGAAATDQADQELQDFSE
jgi:hypothetical protein